jgi:hypothetical protein
MKIEELMKMMDVTIVSAEGVVELDGKPYDVAMTLTPQVETVGESEDE